MRIEELVAQAVEANNAGGNMTLVLPRPWKGRPKGFPRGELLCEQPGSGAYSYDPMKILTWLHKNELISVSIKEKLDVDAAEASGESGT